MNEFPPSIRLAFTLFQEFAAMRGRGIELEAFERTLYESAADTLAGYLDGAAACAAGEPFDAARGAALVRDAYLRGVISMPQFVQLSGEFIKHI